MGAGRRDAQLLRHRRSQERRLGCLLSFSKEGRWASLLVGEYFGNIPPEEAIAHVERIEALVGGRFAFSFLKLEGDEMLPKEDWLAYVSTIKDWQPIAVP